MTATERAPQLGDPIVSDGTKYRIREITPTLIRARLHFGAGMPERARWFEAHPSHLTWDKVVGVWRVGS